MQWPHPRARHPALEVRYADVLAKAFGSRLLLQSGLTMQAAGGAARGCAALTSDVEYSNRFRALPMTHRQRLLHGVQSVGVGFYEGAIGIVKEPLVGWQVRLTFPLHEKLVNI